MTKIMWRKKRDVGPVVDPDYLSESGYSSITNHLSTDTTIPRKCTRSEFVVISPNNIVVVQHLFLLKLNTTSKPSTCLFKRAYCMWASDTTLELK